MFNPHGQGSFNGIPFSQESSSIQDSSWMTDDLQQVPNIDSAATFNSKGWFTAEPGPSTRSNSVVTPAGIVPPPNQSSSAEGQYPALQPFGTSSNSFDSTTGGATDSGDLTRRVSGASNGNGNNKSKKKRRKEEVKDEISPTAAEDKEKRIKTGRACDACRSKKIRCDILTVDSDGSGGSEPLCAHCKQYNLECTFFLPITETRFKKKKTAEEHGEQTLSVPSSLRAAASSASPVVNDSVPPGKSAWHGRLEGPTSIPFLLHTTLPSRSFEQYDVRNHTHWEVTELGDGLIRVNAPPQESGGVEDDPGRSSRLAKSVLSGQIISSLVNSYFEHVAPLFPIVSRAEFTASKASPNPLLLYAICGIAATRREFPREVFAGIRGVINGLIRSNDILSDARLEHVQALLILSQVGDLNAQPTAATASASLLRHGTAIRMAQDLGLHREATLRPQTPQELAYIELRRRVWAACVILDRWYGAALGIPLVIDLYDCDVLLPAPYEIVPELPPTSWPIDPTFVALAEHLKLSIIVGRVLKTVYGPTGLKHAKDEQLESIFADMTAWSEGLPDDLKYKGGQSSHAAGLLHLGHAALQFLLWRVFMRITHTCPPHLTFSLNIHRWTRMVEWSREAIEWISQNDDVLDTLFIYPYTATSCALVQYHTWARRRDPAALDTLKLVKETIYRWETVLQPDQMSIRRKTCETMTLLYEAALKTNHETDARTERAEGNPTPGVQPRASIGKTVFVRDDALPGGGIFVARSEQELEAAGVPRSSVALASEIAHTPANPTPTSLPETQASSAPASVSAPFPEADALQTLMLGTSNVNPHIGDVGDVAAQLFDQPPDSVFDSSVFNVSILDTMPDANFDWNSWGQYFETLDRMFPNNNIDGQSSFAG